MLTLDGEPWSVGSAPLEIGRTLHHVRMTTAVQCQLGASTTTLAFLDTGCALTVIGSELAELLADEVDPPIERGVRLQTRLGQFEGAKHRCPITLLATAGRDLQLEGTVLLAPEWPGPAMLGFTNVLERVRFALDPGTGRREARWYFGPL